MTKLSIVLAVLCGVGLSGCVFVQPTEAGKKVRVLTGAEVDRCRPLGNITSSVTDRIGIIVRRQDTVEDDVLQNAKNAAADMGGDTIVASGPLTAGQQTFEVYRCLTP